MSDTDFHSPDAEDEAHGASAKADESVTGGRADEIDPEAEQVVVRALCSLMEGRTVVMVTHRPALLELADRVLTVTEGRIAELPARRERALRGEAHPMRHGKRREDGAGIRR